MTFASHSALAASPVRGTGTVTSSRGSSSMAHRPLAQAVRRPPAHRKSGPLVREAPTSESESLIIMMIAGPVRARPLRPRRLRLSEAGGGR